MEPLSSNREESQSARMRRFLNSRINYELNTTTPYTKDRYKLHTMRALLERLGDPQQRLGIVHIAGTKGKGSTAHMVSSILAAAGLSTGVYTSPHLHRVEERICIRHQPCSPDELTKLLAEVKPLVDQMDEEAAQQHVLGRPTYFEIVTALAMESFARAQVDAAVLEVGMGGRLDSTNVCTPRVSVITSISFDHVRQLGNTLACIAGEKAGIIKPGVPVVSGVTESEPAEVIREVARRQGSPLFELGRDFFFDYFSTSDHGQDHPGGFHSRRPELTFRALLSGQAISYPRIPLAMCGYHQAQNAAVATVAATLFCSGDESRLRPLDEQVVQSGLAAVQAPARIEQIPYHPPLLIDMAHNVASVQALTQTLDERFPRGKRLLVLATSRDKDAAGMLGHLLTCFDEVILTRFMGNPRSLSPERLLEIADQQIKQIPASQRRCVRLQTASDPHDALRQLQARRSEIQFGCVAGSAFIAGEIREAVTRRAASAAEPARLLEGIHEPAQPAL